MNIGGFWLEQKKLKILVIKKFIQSHFWWDFASREHLRNRLVGGRVGFASYRAQTYIKWKLSMSRLGICKAFRCAPKIFWLMAKKHFLRFGFRQIKKCPISPNILFRFNKWKLMIPASYFMQKIEEQILKIQNLAKNCFCHDKFTSTFLQNVWYL